MRFLRKSRAPSLPTFHQSQQGVPSFLFDGLSEPDVVSIYNVCQIKKFEQTQEAYSGNGRLKCLFVVIEGCVQFRFCIDGEYVSIDYHEGEIIGFISFEGINFEHYMLIAKNKSTIMEISQDAFNIFSDSIKILFYKKLNIYYDNNYFNTIIRNNEIFDVNKRICKYINSLNSKADNINSSEFIQKIIKSIPRLPTYAYELTEKLYDENTQMQDIVDCIHKDPSLASLILKTVNSSYYSMPQKINDIYHAVVFLGSNNIYQIVMSKAVQNVLPKNEEFHSIQNHSTIVSTFSYEIALISKKAKPLTCSTIGLLHEIGSIVILLLQRKYPNISELFGLLDNAKIGANLLAAWGLPPSICEVIEQRDRPAFTPPGDLQTEYDNEIAVLYLARVCCDLTLARDLTSDIFLKDYMAALGLSQQSIEIFYKHRLLPALVKDRKKLPPGVHKILKEQGVLASVATDF